MLKSLPTLILTSALCLSAQAAHYPFQPTTVADYSNTDARDVSTKRLRLAISTEGLKPDQDVKIGDLIFCSSTACFRPSPKSYVTIHSTLEGRATILFDSSVPYGEIKSIYFGETPGQKTVSGQVSLKAPLVLGKDVQGADILVVLKKKISTGKVVYFPQQAVSSYLDNEAEVVYYDPASAASVQLPLGVNLRIPAGATENAQIFSVAVRNVGNAYPSIDIFPYIETKKEFSVTSEVMARGKSATIVPQTPEPTSGVTRSSVSSDSSGTVTKKFTKTGLLKISRLDREGDANSLNASSNAVVVNQCWETLSNPANQNTIESYLQQTGFLNVNWCENTAPFVHIGIINTMGVQASAGLAYSAKYPEVMNLKTISELNSLSKSAITVNGFYWAGDEGTGPNQTGRPSGYAKFGNEMIGVNYTSGVSQGNKRVLATVNNNYRGKWLDYDKIYNFLPDTFVISSSTSIRKDGVCTTDTLKNRWSALGEKDGRYVVISSTSDGETSAYDLCTIFSLLKIDNAIRLDGGPSTGMTFGSTLVNPLTGWARLKYGSQRHIAYSVKFWK
ncbi:phosphodiester glycosidase family protein [Duganella sp. FT27W]|uniref:phosphodiester glycosidase family protein n=1 Tax=Duganella sp. FT27W TaxID=2654636 RepID=UPI00128BEAAF|nr:phosphodiester glycosidase family protein [Duganella sp. FT27W]MPQ56308.1 hypothetical protein [Duganella sp. FT27W]